MDFVMTWVDGNDPEWKKQMLEYSNEKGDKRDVRFRDWNTLKYWFRGVEKFTPWVNKIHFVTWGHIPEWLNLEHPKLNVVKHEDYIPEEYLPTFSSHTIELNLHRIPGISQEFVYFNDDTFIMKFMNEEDFFVKGLPRDIAVIMPNISTFRNSTAPIVSNIMEVINVNFDKNSVFKKNLWKWLNLRYGKHLFSTILSIPYNNFIGFYNPHLPNSYLRKTFEEVWDKEQETLHKTCLNRFRDKRDVNQWIFRYWQFMKGDFFPISSKIGQTYSLTNCNEEIFSVMKKNIYKMICINDNDKDKIKNFELEKNNLVSIFEEIFPEKSSFEKTNI